MYFGVRKSFEHILLFDNAVSCLAFSRQRKIYLVVRTRPRLAVKTSSRLLEMENIANVKGLTVLKENFKRLEEIREDIRWARNNSQSYVAFLLR